MSQETPQRSSGPPKGQWIVLIGPDGVGKTSVAQGLWPLLEASFTGLRYHHWLPAWAHPLRSEIAPGGSRFEPKPCRGGWVGAAFSLLRLARNVTRAWAGYLLRIRPSLAAGRLVLGDRYLFNYHLDPQSVRYKAAPRWVKYALKRVPKPGLVISLVADPQVIHARKAELTPEQIAVCMARTRELRRFGFHVVEISAQEPLDTVIARVAEAILKNACP